MCEFLRNKIRERVHDPATAELLCPDDHPLGTKRMCVDTGYFETYNRPNVRLVSIRETPIEEITETGLRVAGEEFTFDTIVLGTGFDAMTGALLAVDLRGRGGLSLREKWAEGPRSSLGLTIAGFPNLFTVTGPGSPSVLSNMMVSIEQHVDWIADCIAHLREHGIATIEPSGDTEDAWVDHVREVGDASLYPRAKSWYMGANIPGKPRVLLPYVGGVGAIARSARRSPRRATTASSCVAPAPDALLRLQHEDLAGDVLLDVDAAHERLHLASGGVLDRCPELRSRWRTGTACGCRAAADSRPSRACCARPG